VIDEGNLCPKSILTRGEICAIMINKVRYYRTRGVLNLDAWLAAFREERGSAVTVRLASLRGSQRARRSREIE
jgi:hypothetical protein